MRYRAGIGIGLLPGFALLVLIVGLARTAEAGCGCNKPPPKPAAIIPNVAAPGTAITLHDRRFRRGAKWTVTFTSGSTSQTVVTKVIKRRDITDSTGKTRNNQLVVTVPNLPPGPASILARRGRAKLRVPEDSFVVMGAPVVVSDQNSELQLQSYSTAVGMDGTFYISVGGLNTVCDPMEFQAVLDNYPLRFSDGDVLIFNWQGYFIDSLTPASHNRFQVQTGNGNQSNQLYYFRHSFQQYCIDHLPGGPKQVDPADPNWHLDGTPHVDYATVIFAITGNLNGAAQQPGLVTSPLELQTSIGDGSLDWEPEQPEEGVDGP
jgi:hypothetical protein